MKRLIIILCVICIKVNAQRNDTFYIKKVAAEMPEKDTTTKIFTFVEVPPNYNWGEDSLKKFVQANIHYDSLNLPSGFKGRVVLRFVICPNGKVINPEITKGLSIMNETNKRYEITPANELISTACSKEALRISELLHFTAGRQHGNSVYVYYNLPIYFTAP